MTKERILLNNLKGTLLDPLAKDLADKVEWWELKGVSRNNSDLYPVAIAGKGPPIILLHGFDSSFLEFRRLVPLLIQHHQIIIPDLFGFGFCPRPEKALYGTEALIFHLTEVLACLPKESKIGVIGASMGGAIAMRLARRHPQRINRLLLLSPAGLTGKAIKVPSPFDQLGVWFLSRPKVRKGLCRQAFADPAASVGAPEEQIASLHLNVPGWGRSLAAFARTGGVANCGAPKPSQPIQVLWGANDRILQGSQKKECIELIGSNFEELTQCGHLPHLDQAEIVAKRWTNLAK